MYLHEQLHLVGAEPVSLERVSNYRGLNSRSIRVRPAVDIFQVVLLTSADDRRLDSSCSHGKHQQKAQLTDIG
jgi:hypothetical protein